VASVFATIGVVGVVACSAGSTHPPPQSDGTSGDASSGGTSGVTPPSTAPQAGGNGDAGFCSGLTLDHSPPIPQQRRAEDPPRPIAGGIIGGARFYYLASDTIYTGPGGATGPTGVIVQGARVFEDQSLATRLQIAGTVVDTSGGYSLSYLPVPDAQVDFNTLTYAITCPSTSTTTWTYLVPGPQGSFLEFVGPNEVRSWE